MAIVSPSLFAAPPAPVLPAAAQWLSGTLLGTVAITLCILAVAFVGLAMMSGRIAVREGIRVALGCFVLLGAPTIASGVESLAKDTVTPSSVSAAGGALLPDPIITSAPH